VKRNRSVGILKGILKAAIALKVNFQWFSSSCKRQYKIILNSPWYINTEKLTRINSLLRRRRTRKISQGTSLHK